MPTELVYVPVEDAKLERLLEASEATSLTVEELIQRAVTEFLEQRRWRGKLVYSPKNNHEEFALSIDVLKDSVESRRSLLAQTQSW